MDIGGSANLQSGFVLAVILFAVFFADRVGGSEQLAKRAYQIVLGVLLAFLVISATTAFVRPPDTPSAVEEEFFGFDDGSGSEDETGDYLQDVSRRNSVVTTAHVGMGMILVGIGIAVVRSRKTLSIGVLLGGMLLVLFGGVQGTSEGGDPTTILLSFYSSAFGGLLNMAGQARDVVHFAVLLVGTSALAAFGLWRWDRNGVSEIVAQA